MLMISGTIPGGGHVVIISGFFSPFPGDLPIFDMLLLWSLVLMGVFGSVAVYLRVRSSRMGADGRSRYVRASWALLLTGMAFLMPGLLAVGRRHFGDWRVIRSAIVSESNRIRATLRGRSRLTDGEFDEWRRYYAEKHIGFEVEGGHVEMKLLSADPPYVGFDFGGGSNAMFEPRTMLCIYTD